MSLKLSLQAAAALVCTIWTAAARSSPALTGPASASRASGHALLSAAAPQFDNPYVRHAAAPPPGAALSSPSSSFPLSLQRFPGSSSNATLQLQNLVPSACAAFAPYNSCWTGYNATVAGNSFHLVSTSNSKSCSSATASLAAPNIAAGEFSDGSRLGAAGGTAFPIPFSRLDGQQTVTGVGLLVDDDRAPDGFCTGVFKVAEGTGPFLTTRADMTVGEGFVQLHLPFSAHNGFACNWCTPYAGVAPLATAPGPAPTPSSVGNVPAAR